MNSLTSARFARTDDDSWYVADGYDPIPKPLCITKKRTKPSTSKKSLRRRSIILQTFSALESHSGGFGVPRRLSSTAFAQRANASSASVSSKSSRASSAGYSKLSVENPKSPLPSTTMLRRNGTLSVRKHRSRDTAPSPSAIGSLTSEGIPGNQQHINPSPSPQLTEDALGSFKRPTTPTTNEAWNDEDTPRATRTSNRSVTVVPHLETGPLNSSHIQRAPLIRQAPTGLDHTDPRRTTSARERPPPTRFLPASDKVGHVICSGPALGFALPGSRDAFQRQPSVKHRILSRVLSGFKDKPRSIMATTPAKVRGDLERRSSYARSGPTPPHLDETMKDPSARPRSITASSTETDFDLDGALAAFPTPPSSTLTSPTGIGSIRTPVHTSRALLKPEDPIILSAGLKILPEIESIDSDGGQTIWVAVEVSGDLKMPGRMSQGLEAKHGLIVAVIIDNSSFTSPSALMSSCELVAKIASFLDTADDKLAVLCIHGDSMTHSSGTHVIVPLRSVNVRKVKSLLDGVRSSNKSIEQQEDFLEEAIRTAFDVLSHSDSEKMPEVSSHPLSGHVFLITANTDYVPSTPLKNETFHVHVVHPGIVPWNCRKDLPSNGWQLRSMYPPKLESVALSNEEGGLPAKVRALIQYARTGNQPGSLSDLVLDIRPGPDCRIEGIIGSIVIATLSPGEVISAFVKLKLGRFPLAFSALSTFELGPNETPSTAELMAQLGTMVGERGTEILSVEVCYKHSLLPENTQLSVTATSMLRRQVPESSWDGDPPVSNVSQVKDSQIQIQKRLAFFIATHHTPRRALSTLQSIFGINGCLSTDPVYIRLVTEELRYQGRITERFDLLDDDPVSNRSSINSTHMSLVGGPLSNISNRAVSTPSPHRRRPPTAIKHEACLDRPMSQESVDKAHKIWTEIRKNSKAAKDGEGVPGDSTQLEITDENIRQIQEIALKNKRSLGADTLKSFVQAERTSGSFAPWL